MNAVDFDCIIYVAWLSAGLASAPGLFPYAIFSRKTMSFSLVVPSALALTNTEISRVNVEGNIAKVFVFAFSVKHSRLLRFGWLSPPLPRGQFLRAPMKA